MTVPSLPLPQFTEPVGEGNGVTFHMTNLPKVVAIQKEAFHRNTVHTIHPLKMKVKGGTHSVVRWSYKADHQTGQYLRDTTTITSSSSHKLVKESNSNIIQWSDGTWDLWTCWG